MSEDSRNNGPTTEGRNPDGTFAPGNPGRPRGARHKATRAALELMEGEAEALSRKAVDLALAGDMQALRLCIERILPARKDGPVNFDLPPINTTADAVRAMGAIADAVASGELTPAEGNAVGQLVEGFVKAIEVRDLERRLAALEARQ